MKSLSQFYRKIKCFLGLHEWIYQVEPIKYKIESINRNLSSEIDSLISTRFCTTCYKKSIRDRQDMHIYWRKTDLKLTKDQTRLKNLDILTDGKD